MLNLLFQTRKAFALTAGVFSILYGSYALAACSVHDHGCVYHAGGAKVSSTYNPTGPTSLVMYTIGTNGSGGAARTDFDTHALLPSMTGDPKLGLGYTQPTGPYIVNTTPYGATHTPPTWNSSTELPLHVYPSQYGVTFNSNTAVATHTGDFNGGENGNIPGATGCPNMPGAPNCEAVVVTGNVPNGIYQQQVQLFNYYNLPNPSVDLQVGAYTTGSAVLVTPGHTATETANFTSLSGSGSYTPVYSYEVYNRGFDPHAAGVAFFDRTKSRSHSEITTGDHTRTTYKVTDFAKLRTLIDAQGNAAQRVMAQWQTRTAVKTEATCTQIAGMCVSSAQLAHLAATMKMPQPGQSPFGCIGVGCPVGDVLLSLQAQKRQAESYLTQAGERFAPPEEFYGISLHPNQQRYRLIEWMKDASTSLEHDAVYKDGVTSWVGAWKLTASRGLDSSVEIVEGLTAKTWEGTIIAAGAAKGASIVGNKLVGNAVSEGVPLWTDKSIFNIYPKNTTLQVSGTAEQAKFLATHIPELSEAQAQIILDKAFERNSSAVFGGSRIRGGFTSGGFGIGSDIDVGFGGLNANQAGKVIDALNKNFSKDSSMLMLERTRITPGNSTPTITKPIVSPEEFFQRSGIRVAPDPKAGQPYVPSGSVTVTPGGQIIISPPKAP